MITREQATDYIDRIVVLGQKVRSIVSEQLTDVSDTTKALIDKENFGPLNIVDAGYRILLKKEIEPIDYYNFMSLVNKNESVKILIYLYNTENIDDKLPDNVDVRFLVDAYSQW